MYRLKSLSLLLAGVVITSAATLLFAGEIASETAAPTNNAAENAAIVKTTTSEAEANVKTEAEVKTEVEVTEAAPIKVVPTEAAQADAVAPNTTKSENAEQVAQDPVLPAAEPQIVEVTREVKQIDEPTDEAHRQVFYAFREKFPSMPVEAIRDGPFTGLYEIVADSQVIYVDIEVTRLFQGSVIDLTNGIDLTESRLAGIHMGLINELGEENMLVYKAEKPANRSITVFTDINCGYCRLLHSEIDTLLQAGVNVRYLMFPRAGLDSDSRVALESVWCADDPQAAMTSAKAGEPIAQKSCQTPVETHVALARQVGLRGTPLIYLDNGTSIPGYREAGAIIEMLNSSEPMTN